VRQALRRGKLSSGVLPPSVSVLLIKTFAAQTCVEPEDGVPPAAAMTACFAGGS
jgi:hypothetical protein